MVTLGTSFDDVNNVLNVSEKNSEKERLVKTQNRPSLENPSTLAELLDGRYGSKFVSSNVINMSKCHLSKVEMPLLLKGLIFIPIPKQIHKAFIKEELETHGKKLRLVPYYHKEGKKIHCYCF